MYNYVQIGTTMYNYVLCTCTTIYLHKYVQLCTCTNMYNNTKNVYNCTILYTLVQLRTIMYNIVQTCTTMYNCVQLCKLYSMYMHNYVQHYTLCTTMYDLLQHCTTMYNHVQHCTNMYTHLQVCTSMYNYALCTRTIMYNNIECV